MPQSFQLLQNHHQLSGMSCWQRIILLRIARRAFDNGPFAAVRQVLSPAIDRMDAHQRFQHIIYRWLYFIDYFLGLNTYAKSGQIRGYTVIVMLLVASFAFCSLWTFFSDDGIQALDAGSYFFVFAKVSRRSTLTYEMMAALIVCCHCHFQFLFKYMFLLTARRKIINLFDLLDNVYRQNWNGHKNQEILNRFTKMLMRFLRFVFINCAASLAGAIFFTIIWNRYSTEYRCFMPAHLPGVPIGTADGFAVNAIWQLGVFAYAGSTYAFFDGLNALLMLHVILLTNILRSKFQTINELAADQRSSQAEIRERIKNVIVLQNELRS